MSTINEFSLLCRLFGNLFLRTPQDPVLTPIFSWLNAGNLTALWPLNTDTQSQQALDKLRNMTSAQIAQDYQQLFINSAVSQKMSDYHSEILVNFVAFREQLNMPSLDQADHVAHMLLTASWLEDNNISEEKLQQFFSDFLLPVMKSFLGQVETHNQQGFYGALAQLCREALATSTDS